MKKTKGQEKHVPMRTCIGTGIKKPKKEMIRLVRLPSGEVCVDVSGKERGRGANIDTNIEAFDQAVSRKAISRALKLERKLSDDEISTLRNQFLVAIEEKQFRDGNKPVTIRVSLDS